MNILYYPNYKLMNHNIPEFKALVRRSWFTKDNADFDTFDSVFVFGLQSVQNKILTFHVMTDYGMLRSRVPLSEIFLFEPKNDVPFHFKQLWDSFKCAHVLYSDDGYLLAMPNNRIIWRDSNWVTTTFPMDLKDIKVDTHIPSVESVSDRWVSENTNSYYYDIIEN